MLKREEEKEKGEGRESEEKRERDYVKLSDTIHVQFLVLSSYLASLLEHFEEWYVDSTGIYSEINAPQVSHHQQGEPGCVQLPGGYHMLKYCLNTCRSCDDILL